MFIVYILFSETIDMYYVGHTANIKDRLVRHNQGRSKSTKRGIPWRLMYSESFKTKPEAYQREMQIKKKKSRKYIENLINSSE
ncbi:excinuclease ABC subunit C [Aquimarina atlantica]|uniref:Excinuclease ABC subunit C n=1 Tax=Aquimarina atlantica TaxID=1317122 RepID=A0A023BVQ9_9FLAO|nr:GIY-YIG nuclease family protein [Aquimarina atlantica]EZH73903.1 excinuclease ABC subunit C [Aquimarina atlantica]